MTSKLQILTNPLVLTITSVSALCTFICSYFLNLYMNNQDQYIAIIGVMFLDVQKPYLISAQFDIIIVYFTDEGFYLICLSCSDFSDTPFFSKY